MKKIYLISASFLLPLYSFAQRGRAKPDDLGYSDNDYSTSSSDGSPTLYIVLLIILFVGVIWFNVALKSSNNKDIKEKRTYVANGSIIAYAKIFPNSGCKPQGPVNISPNTKCYIMEYLEENYCKVKFENHPQPLYVKRNEIILPPKKR